MEVDSVDLGAVGLDPAFIACQFFLHKDATLFRRVANGFGQELGKACWVSDACSAATKAFLSCSTTSPGVVDVVTKPYQV